MPNYIIATSSTSDLPRTYLDAHQIPFIAYSYTVGEQMFEDDCREETRLSVYQGMRSGDRLRTSMINAYLYADFFRSLLDSGKDVIFLDMSQKMSVSYENSKRAVKMLREEYPDRRLYIMDTRCIPADSGFSFPTWWSAWNPAWGSTKSLPGAKKTNSGSRTVLPSTILSI